MKTDLAPRPREPYCLRPLRGGNHASPDSTSPDSGGIQRRRGTAGQGPAHQGSEDLANDHRRSRGTPPAFVVRANKPAFAEPGTAERFKAASRDSLVVAGTATSGTKVDVKVTVVCHPQP